MLIDEKSLDTQLSEALDRSVKQFKKISTGKANVQAIEQVSVEAYGSTTQLNAVAQIIVEDAMNVKISVWDKSIIAQVDKALRESELGASVAIDKDVIRLKFHPITEDDRKKKTKEVQQVAEDFRIRVRQVRQDFMKKLDSLDGVSEDDQERDKKTIQTKIDSTIKQIDEAASKRETEIMSI